MGVLAKAAGSLWDWIEAGYPEEVAKRIVSGELPMDEASRMARAAEQGYGPVLYRGQPDRPLSSNQDIWASTSPDVAQTYADNFTVSHRDALGEDGVVVPLRTNATNMADVNARGRSWHVVESNNRKIPGIESGVLKGTDRISEAVRDSGKYDGTVFRNIPDDAVRLRGAEQADSHNILGSRPDVNIRHADAAYDPKYTGPNIMGGVLAGGVGLGALSQSEEADAGFVTRGGKTLLEAWHGSPHKFDKFSMDQIGTGEGAQAYGHGLYFADVEDVARGYRDTLKYEFDPREGVNSIVNRLAREQRGAQVVRDVNTGKTYDYDPNNPVHRQILDSGQVEIIQGGDSLLEAVAREMSGDKRLVGYANDRDIVAEIANVIRGQEAGGTVTDSAMRSYSNLNQMLRPPDGHLYRTEIDVTPESLLDWDKPLSEQSDYVKEAFKKIPQGQVEITPNVREGSYWVKGKNWRGGNVNRVARGLEQAERVAAKARGIDLNSQGDIRAGALIDNTAYDQREALSNTLREAGIPGIKYLDGDSRAAGNGTSNYVIFDDSLINIAERGNATVPALGVLATGTGAALAAPALKSEGLEKATGFLDETIRSARHAAGPFSFLVPYEGISNFAKKWNADEDLTWQDYLGLLDF